MALDAIKSRFRADLFSVEPDVLEKYGQDWSGVLKPRPAAIAFPRSTEEVAALLGACNDLGLAVVPSGGRTGLSGGAVAANGEIVLSLEKMNRIGALDPQALTLEVEAGAITEAVHVETAKRGLTWPVDFASKGSSQIGGNLATNAGGIRVIRYGLTRNWVLGLTAVTMSGEILRLNGALEKNNTGIDLRQLFIGSEGTLGVITEAVLKLCPLPRDERTQVCFFALRDFGAVLRLFAEARKAPFTLSAFECLSDACLREVVRHGVRSPVDPGTGEAYVVMEAETENAEAFEAWLGRIFSWEEQTGAPPLVLDGTLALSSRERAELWSIRERVAESVMTGAEVHQQDLSVPIAALAAFFTDVEARYATAYPEFRTFIFGHIGDGNLHIFIRKPADMASEVFHARCAESDTMLFELCQKFAGSVSAEHGVGLLKKPALGYTRSPQDLAYVRALKRALDPKGLLNPGKIV
ncbi:MAG: FAD-binding oxidoreductase [Bdellovibrionales bacterium]|nr:FAD-binding oxidoreductase [Bdellovibrionales bacterium]